MADQRIQASENMIGANHPTLSDTLNRLTLVAHETDGTHKFVANTTESTTTGTGAIVTAGGIGVAKNITCGGSITGTQLASTIITGTAPLVVSSTTVVTNLNADTVDGFHASQNAGAGQIPVFDSNGALKVASGEVFRKFGGFMEYGFGHPSMYLSQSDLYISGNAYYSDDGKWYRLTDGPAAMLRLTTAGELGLFTASNGVSGTEAVFNGVHPFWNSLNDGSGSGLDADLLDGQHGSYYQPASDVRLKQNITPISTALNTIMALEPVRFEWNSIANELGADRQTYGIGEIGLVAQDVQAVIPEAVMNWIKQGEQGQTYLTVDYRPIIAMLIKSVQELSVKNSALEDKLLALEIK